MKTINGLIGLGLLAITIGGCAPTVKRGVVAMKINEQRVHVTLGKDDVSVGDQVTFYQNVCQPEIGTSKPPNPGRRCEKEYAGKGTVVSQLGDKFSDIEVAQGATISEGYVVER
jgi:hypothetical protein